MAETMGTRVALVAYSKATFVTETREYAFDIARDESTGTFVAQCNLENGGVCTEAASWSELFGEMIPDAVATFEMQ